jgi:hypothetical protein
LATKPHKTKPFVVVFLLSHEQDLSSKIQNILENKMFYMIIQREELTQSSFYPSKQALCASFFYLKTEDLFQEVENTLENKTFVQMTKAKS